MRKDFYLTTRMKWLYCIIGCVVLSSCSGFIAYDCSHTNITYTKISLQSVGECSSVGFEIQHNEERIQLIELQDSYNLNVYRCHVSVHRNAYHCGMHSHISAVKNGFAQYMYNVGRSECLRAHETGRMSIETGPRSRHDFHGLLPGALRREAMTFAGVLSETGACEPGYYSDPFGEYNNVVVTGFIEVMLTVEESNADSTQDVLHIPTGIKCPLSKENCVDSVLGELYWKTLPEDECKSNQVHVLFQGLANVTQHKGRNDNNGLIYTVKTSDMLFSLRVTRSMDLCSTESYRTEHPKLIIVRQHGTGYHFKKYPVKANQMDMFAYINSKFVYIERNIELNMKDLYDTITKHTCQLERHILQTKLFIAQYDANEFASHVMQEPGYTGTVVGEVIYISKCLPVLVEVRKTHKCYKQLPILYNNLTRFLIPKHHLIQNHGEEIDCNSIFMSNYYINNVWYSVNDRLQETTPPQSLSPSSPPKWTFKNTASLATAGIYTSEDLTKLRDHIMYGTERDAIQTILTRQMLGKGPDLQGLHTYAILDEEGINHLSKKFSERIWGWFTNFGTFISGIMGIFIVFRIIKWAFDTLLNGISLYKVYGISFTLFASIWDSLTLCLLSRYEPKTRSETTGVTSPQEINLLANTDNIESHQKEPKNETKTLNPLVNSTPIRQIDPHNMNTGRLYPNLSTGYNVV